MSEENPRTIYLYGDQIGSVSLVAHMGTDLTIVNSARVSFGNTKTELNDKDRRLIKFLVKHKHTSTFEHNVATFKFVVPLFVRSQHHRHRTWSYNEISRRYTEKNMAFYLPSEFRTQHRSNRQASNPEELINPGIWEEGWGRISKYNMTMSELLEIKTKECLETYKTMLDKGVCREQARMILPQNLYTKYYATANLNNILKFIELRIHEGAQWEIQQLAKGMLDILIQIWPFATNAYREINAH